MQRSGDMLIHRTAVVAAAPLLLTLACSSGTGGGTNATGGGGGMGGNVGAGGDAVGLCGEHADLGNNAWVRAIGAGASIVENTFEGFAIVERSVENELTVYYEPPHTTISAGYHATISGWAPVLPAGAKLWMSKAPVGNQIRDATAYGQDPWSISLWDREGGTLLLQAARDIELTRTTECAALDPSHCSPGLAIYYTVEVPGDPALVLNDGETGILNRGGRSYDVHVSSQRQPPRSMLCADYRPQDLTCLDLKLRDPADLTFDMGNPPACIEGNDFVPRFYAYILNVPDFDGRIAYLETQSGTLIFDVGGERQAQVAVSPGLLAEPTVGQEFWLTIHGATSALRASQNGEILVAAIESGPRDAFAAVLGMTVTVEDDCAYAVDSSATITYLKRFVFGSTPPVTVRSGSRSTLPIGAQDYHVATRRGADAVIWK